MLSSSSLLLLVAPALAGGRYAGLDSDVVVTATLSAEPEHIQAYLLDLTHQPELWPEDCASRWRPGQVTEGRGATMGVTYYAREWNRTLTMVLSSVTDQRRITLDHPGNKGFTTTWTYTPAEDGTQVELHTWIQPPPWPFRKPWYERVRPAWQECHQRALSALAEQLEGTDEPSPPSSSSE